MNPATSSGLSRPASSASHTAHDAGASAKQASSYATPSNPSNRNCQQPNFATDIDLQPQPYDQQVIGSITDVCALELENFQCEARDVLDQMTIATMRLMNNVPTTQTIDQTIRLRTIMIKATQSMKQDVHRTAKMIAH
uniref:Biogenesis of lysosome-related organelles complex 1 subunit 7 n=1 Tax=Romanomermis culicivorax TaxID=13658 RepID=A0A915KUG2_ROMCU